MNYLHYHTLFSDSLFYSSGDDLFFETMIYHEWADRVLPFDHKLTS